MSRSTATSRPSCTSRLQPRVIPSSRLASVTSVVGERRPGEIFGEVPITLGTLFPVGFRAADRSRVLRLGPQDCHAAVAACPEIGTAVGALAAHRIGGPGGLQGIAADAPPAR